MGNSFKSLSEGIESAKDLTELGLDWLSMDSNTSFFAAESPNQPEPEIYNDLAAKHWKLLRTMPRKFQPRRY